MSELESWHEEKQSAWLYEVLAEREPDAAISALFRQLAAAAEDQAKIWEQRLGRSPAFQPTRRARIVAGLVRVLRPRTLRPVLAAMKVRGLSAYTGGTPASHVMPTTVEQVGGRHRGVGGGNLRAAVFGVNDGLVSNTSLIMGIAGASSQNSLILTTGVAGLLAGALSMAAGEYVSMRSQREMYESQIALEKAELEEYPEEEIEELALIYNTRGMELEAARGFARELMRNPRHALNTLAREELGLNPDDLGSPWGAAVFSFLAFTAGAVVPLLPFLFRPGAAAVPAAAALAGTSLFVVGAMLSLFTGRRAWWGGARMVLIGGGAGIVTYLIGYLLGVSLG
ncbi:MAG: VIT1/CCC1 transporter family protein [Acidiferrobacteraceae bacterium]|jgi:VIT1/CCC1 family predicted Fe2+/Mn2+ transporter